MKEKLLEEVFLGNGALHLLSLKETIHDKKDIKKTRESKVLKTRGYLILKLYKTPL